MMINAQILIFINGCPLITNVISLFEEEAWWDVVEIIIFIVALEGDVYEFILIEARITQLFILK